jgi:hypothetical protein
MSQSVQPLTVNVLRYVAAVDAYRRLPLHKRNHPGLLEQLTFARIAAERDLEKANRGGKESDMKIPEATYAKAAALDAGTAAKGAELAIEAAKRAEDAPARHAEQEAQRHARGWQRELSAPDRSILGRLSPRRSPWPQLDEHDQRLAGLDQKLAETQNAIRELEQTRVDADDRDKDTLAGWFAGAEKGARPEPTAPRIAEQLDQLRADAEALETVVAHAAEERGRFIEKHAEGLATHADRLAAERYGRYLELIDELAVVRDDIVGLTGAANFARTFPAPESAVEMPNPLSMRPAGQRGELTWAQVVSVLRADAERLATVRQPKAKVRAEWDNRDRASVALAENVARMQNEWA